MQNLDSYYESVYAALGRLKTNASSDDLAFYTSMEEMYKTGQEYEKKMATQSPTIESLKKKLARMDDLLSRLQFEADFDRLGKHWQQWAREEAVTLSKSRTEVINQLKLLGYQGEENQTTTELSVSEYLAGYESEADGQRIEEIQMLIALKASWLRQKNKSEDDILAHPEMVTLKSELEILTKRFSSSQ